jgi:hypothetical protein
MVVVVGSVISNIQHIDEEHDQKEAQSTINTLTLLTSI